MWVCTSLGRFTIPSVGVTQRSYHAHAVSCVIGKPGRFTTFIVHESKSAVCPRGDITSSLKFAHCKHNLRNGPAKELSGPCIPVMPYKNIWGCSGLGADTLSHQGTVKYLGISNFLMLIFNTLLNWWCSLTYVSSTYFHCGGLFLVLWYFSVLCQINREFIFF